MTAKNVFMYDSVSVDQLPADSRWVAGYADGRYANLTAMRRRFPHAHIVSIAVAAGTDALALDIERYDASVYEAPGWTQRQLHRGVRSPILYVQVSHAQILLEVMASAGIDRSDYRLWTAHWSGKPHICDHTCGFSFTGQAGATQFSSRAPAGANFDTSLVAPRFQNAGTGGGMAT